MQLLAPVINIYATFRETFVDDAITRNLKSLVPGKRFLDIGGKLGMNLVALCTGYNAANTIDGFVIQEKMVKPAKVLEESIRLQIRAGNVANMPYSDGMFDAATSLFITCSLSVHTFEKHFQELYRVLAPGGKAILLITTDWCHSRLYTKVGADPVTVEKIIADTLSTLPKNPTAALLNAVFRDNMGIYVTTFAVDAEGNAFRVKNISQLTECQLIWTYTEGIVFPSYFHSDRSVITNILSAGLCIDSIEDHFTEERRVVYNTQEPSIPMKCVKEPLALVYHVSKPNADESPY